MPARSQSSRMAKMILSSASKQGWLPDCFCMCVCVCVHGLKLPCATPLPSHTEAANEDPDMTEVWAHHPLWLAGAGDTVEVTCTVIGWPKNQWKIFPFPLIPVALLDIAHTCMSTYNLWFCFCACIYVAHNGAWEYAFVRHPPDLVQCFAQTLVTSSHTICHWKTEVIFRILFIPGESQQHHCWNFTGTN